MADLKTVAAIVFTRQGQKVQYLLLRAARNANWDPPKGKVDFGETEMETATRELYEETGIRQARFVAGFRESVRYQVDKNGELRWKETVFFLCEADVNGVQLSYEHTEAHLATIEEVEMLLHRDETKGVFHKADELLKKQVPSPDAG
jgi:bis(5'-nucleosidyl)-tetraphosphatase